MKALFIADPLSSLQPKSDTSLYFLRECFKRDWNCFWASADELSWKNSEVFVQAQIVLNCGDRSALPQLGTRIDRSILDFDCIFIRKDPPFDGSYLRMCWVLAAFEDRVLFSNRPSLLLRHHEKMLPLEAYSRAFISKDFLIQTCITDSPEVARNFAESLSGHHLILKPWLGHGGRDIKLLDRGNFVKDPKPHLKTEEPWIIQAFEEGIFESGDRRVFFVHGKYSGDFVRVPKSGQFVSNLVRGGRAILREMNEKEKILTNEIEKFLSFLKIDFAGADYISSKLSEINITSPTGLGSFEDLTGKDLSSIYLDGLEERIKLK